MTIKLPIYLDNHATTKVDPEALDAMLPFFSEKFGNIASGGHIFGREVSRPVADARASVAKIIGASPDEIIFTSGATESNNLALKGVAECFAETGRHIITVQTEHKCILNTCKFLESRGFDVTYLGVDRNGRVSPTEFEKALRLGNGGKDRTVLASIMAANNEIGTIHPIAEIADICEKRGVILHIDAAQAVGKFPFDVGNLSVQLVSFTAHKMYGPKGIGAMYVRRKDPLLKLTCQMHGGGQEWGFRSGTLPVPLVVGFGRACDIAMRDLAAEGARLSTLRQRLWEKLYAGLKDDVILNGHPTERIPGNLHVSFKNIDSELLSISMKDVAVSSGSACQSATVAPSHVLKALGLDDETALSSLRFGIGRFNTEEEIDFAAKRTLEVVEKLRLKRPNAGTPILPTRKITARL